MDTFLSLIYTDEELYLNKIIYQYIKRELKRGGFRVLEEFYSKNNLYRVLNSKDGNYLIVATTKTIAQIREYLENNFRLIKFKDESYLFLREELKINLTLFDNFKLSPILFQAKKSYHYHIFPTKKDIFLEFIKSFKDISYIELTSNWYKVESNHKIRDFSKVDNKVVAKESIIEALIEYLSKEGKKITFAESCTGGLLASTFTAKSGASAILDGSYITYSNGIKEGWLGVKRETLERFGAVSAECVKEMAMGASRNLKADIAVAISGIAGPTGAVKGKPIGTVYLCIKNRDYIKVKRLQLKGDRNAIQNLSVLHAIEQIIESEKNFFNFFCKNP